MVTGVAQPSGYTLNKRYIGRSEGLPDQKVTCGIQDKDGFLWFGTQGGLCCYNGTVFTFLSRKTHGLRGTSVLSLSADDSLGIVITYSLPGSSILPDTMIDVVNIRTKEVRTFRQYYPDAPFDQSDIKRIIYGKGKPLAFLLTGHRDFVWELTGNGRFVQKAIKGKALSIDFAGLENLPDSLVEHLNVRLNEEWILMEDSTLVSVNPNFKGILRCRNGFLVSLYDDWFRERPYRHPYFLTFQGEVRELDEKDWLENEFSLLEVNSFAYNYEGDGQVISLHTDQHAAVLELEDHSILFYAPLTGFYRLFDSGENGKVRSFFQDQLGSWWLCSNMGVYKLSATKPLFHTSFTRNEPRFSINNSTRGIYVDDEVMLVNLFDAPVMIYKGDTTLLDWKQNFAAFRSGKDLWIGNYRPLKLDIATGEVSQGPRSNLSEIWSAYPLADSSILLGCSYGIGVYDLRKNQMAEVDYHGFPQAHFVYKVFRNAEGDLMAVAENGLYVLSEALVVTDFYSIYADSSQKKLPFQNLQDVFEDQQGIYWLTSGQEGLFRWDRQHHTFEQSGWKAVF